MKKGSENMTTTVFDLTEVTKRIRRSFAHFDHVKAVHNRLDLLRGHRCLSEEPESIALVGMTGTGKTALLSNYLKSHPRIEHSEFTEVTVLYAEIPARCTIKKLATILLRAIGSPFPMAGDEEDRTHQLITLVKNCKVRLIILDEVNHLVDRGSAKSHYFVGDWIKQLISKTRVPVVLAGTPRVRYLLKTNEQLASRFAETISIEPLSAEEGAVNSIDAALKVFKGMMGDIPSISFIYSENQRLFAFACGGRLRSLSRLITRAVEIGANAGGVSSEVFATAFEQVIYDKCPPERNPFRSIFDGKPLNKIGEPFHITDLEAI